MGKWKWKRKAIRGWALGRMGLVVDVTTSSVQCNESSENRGNVLLLLCINCIESTATASCHDSLHDKQFKSSKQSNCSSEAIHCFYMTFLFLATSIVSCKIVSFHKNQFFQKQSMQDRSSVNNKNSSFFKERHQR